jgi:hypothetical protein
MARLWDEEERYQKGIEEIRALREEKKTGPMFNNENYDEIPEQQREHKEEFEADLEAKVKEQEEVLEDWGWKEKDGRW